MSKMIVSTIRVIMVMLLIMSLVACKPWTIVKNEQKSDDDSSKVYFENDDFEADLFAGDIWANKLPKYLDDNKVKANLLFESLESDAEDAGEQYGIGSSEIGSSWNFIIEGKGKVVEVNSESRAGTMMIDLPPYDNQSDMTIQIGQWI